MWEGKQGLFLAGPVALNHGRAKAPVFPFVVPWLGIQRDGARLLRDLGKIRVPDNWSDALVTSSRAAGQHLKALYTLRPEVKLKILRLFPFSCLHLVAQDIAVGGLISRLCHCFCATHEL